MKLTDDDLSRWIAEKIGWRVIEGPRGWFTLIDPAGKEIRSAYDLVIVRGFRPNMVTDPAMSDMLLEHESMGTVHVWRNPNGLWTVEPEAENPESEIIVSNEDRRRAIAEALALANGYSEPSPGGTR